MCIRKYDCDARLDYVNQIKRVLMRRKGKNHTAKNFFSCLNYFIVVLLLIYVVVSENKRLVTAKLICNKCTAVLMEALLFIKPRYDRFRIYTDLFFMLTHKLRTKSNRSGYSFSPLECNEFLYRIGIDFFGVFPIHSSAQQIHSA